MRQSLGLLVRNGLMASELIRIFQEYIVIVKNNFAVSNVS